MNLNSVLYYDFYVCRYDTYIVLGINNFGAILNWNSNSLTPLFPCLKRIKYEWCFHFTLRFSTSKWDEHLNTIQKVDIYDAKKCQAFSSMYRVIIFRKFTLFTLYWTNLQIFLTQQYCHIRFLFKFFDKSVNKMDFWKMINLCPTPIHFASL